jgi:triosephosphate isomerase
MRFPLVAGNWKMNTTPTEANSLACALCDTLDRIEGVEKVLCPPFLSLVSISGILQGSSIKLGAQNMHFAAQGAYTGEISPLMLQGLCDFVIIGHSERRRYFGENDALLNRKLKAALEYKVSPILCIGEDMEEKEAGKTEAVITRQLEAALSDIKPVPSLVVAYEPIWAIGTGKASSGNEVTNTIKFIRGILSRLWDSKTAQSIRVLYGGSVTAQNIAEFISSPETDGALIGGASLNAREFTDIVRQTAEIKGNAS